jgi:hypothetical protein
MDQQVVIWAVSLVETQEGFPVVLTREVLVEIKMEALRAIKAELWAVVSMELDQEPPLAAALKLVGRFLLELVLLVVVLEKEVATERAKEVGILIQTELGKAMEPMAMPR